MRRYKLGFFAKFLTLAVWYVWPTIGAAAEKRVHVGAFEIASSTLYAQTFSLCSACYNTRHLHIYTERSMEVQLYVYDLSKVPFNIINNTFSFVKLKYS